MPSTIIIPNQVTMFASAQPFLIDTTDKILHDELLQFFRNYIHPVFEQCQKGHDHKEKATKPGSFRLMKSEEPTYAKPGKMASRLPIKRDKLKNE